MCCAATSNLNEISAVKVDSGSPHWPGWTSIEIGLQEKEDY